MPLSLLSSLRNFSFIFFFEFLCLIQISIKIHFANARPYLEALP